MFTTLKVQASSRTSTQSILNRALLAVIVLVVFLILQVTEAVAGTGTFRDGAFNFCVSIRFNATAAEMQRMRDVFQLANQVLYDATDGQHRFGTISLINNSGASDQADIWIHHGGGRGNAGQLLGYGLRGRHINLYNASFFVQPDTMRNALLIVHEFAHFTYGVGDEYRAAATATNPEPFAACPGDDRNSQTLNYCIMDNISAGARRLTTTYSVNEFCVDSNHDKPLTGVTPDQANDTVQSIINQGDACWETMSKIERKWRLNAPSNLPQDAPPATTPLVVFDTSCIAQSQRVVLLIDRSGSMANEDRLKWANTGAFHFISLYGAGDFLGVVSFSTAASVDFPLTQMDAGTRITAQNAVNALTANGLTNLPDGFTLALSQLNSSNCADCQKTIILLSDGDSNVGPPPGSLLSTLQNADVKVIAATVGDISVAGEASLKTIATQTGGVYFRGKTSIDFLQFFVNLAFGTSGFRAVGNAPQQLGPNQIKEIPVLIENGVASTAFTVSLVDPTDNVTVSLRDPSGNTITQSNAPAGQFTSSSGLKMFKIPTPEAGTWTILLSSGTVTLGKVEVLTFSQHDGTDFWASLEDDNVNRSETLKLFAAPTHDGRNVTGASVTGEVVHPNGTKTPITPLDDGLAAHGDAHPADGTYSALFNSYSGPGTYTFNLKYTNTSGQTYVGEPIPDENGVVPSFDPLPVPPVTRLTSVTAVVSSVTDEVWFDDTLPEGATAHGDQETFAWVDLNPAAYSGQLSHQSRNFGQLAGPNAIHGHSFDGAARRLTLGSNDKLFTYVFLDINNMPREIMLEWKDENGWGHRAYWGQNNIQRGVNGTSSRFFMGPLPKPGHWTRLEVWASDLGLVGSTIDGMSFVLDGGNATWDLAGKSAGPGGDFFPPTSFDEIWIDGAVPAGATSATTNDVWDWVSCPAGGSLINVCHRSILAPHNQFAVLRHHQYTGGPPQYINPGDVLFAYVFLDDVIMPNQLFIEWHDGTNWRRAFWGNNWQEVGAVGTENWRYMGGLPTPDEWVRLEVPASYLGLEGRYVSGMSFGFFKNDDNSQILWGRAGKTRILRTAPIVASGLTRVYRYRHPQFGYYYWIKDVKLHSADVHEAPHFFAPPNQASGTVPMYRFRNSSKREFFYSMCKTCTDPGGVWILDGIGFYVYPNASTPGTVPLFLYHDTIKTNQYFLTIDPNEGAGRIFDSNQWGWVYPANLTVPVRPTSLTRAASTCRLSWLDNSNNEEGFKIWKLVTGVGWAQVATVGPNVTSIEDCNIITGTSTSADYLVYAFNSIGDSAPSNGILGSYRKPCKRCIRINDVDAVSDDPPVSDDPTIHIPSPLDGAVVGRNVAIITEAFDEDGNGSINKVEFYAGAQKIGEVIGSPFNFTWSNAPVGTHTLTAVVIDNMGATGTSAPVDITVSDVPVVTLTSPTNGAIVTALANIIIQATASDADGSVAKVEFFAGTTKIGEDTTAPYSFPWNGVQSGTYDLTARVIDNLGLAVTSDLVTITVNNPPAVSLTAPASGLVVLAPANFTLSATASDEDGMVSKVDFYAGAMLVGTQTTAPFTTDWTNVSYGTYNITAKVTDDRGAVTTSAPVTLIVNNAPSVSITSPSNTAMLTPLSTVAINASASDDDGTISQVDFYQGTTLIGTDTTSPFSINWNNVVAGSYPLTAKATDNRGAVTTSVTVAVTAPAFSDDFNDNSLSSIKWSVLAPGSATVVSEQGQQLHLTLPASSATYNGIFSNANYDMAGAAVQVELAESVSQAGWAENMLKIEKDGQNYFLIDTGSGNTLFRSMVNGVNDQLIIPFNAVAHRHWRIRHDQVSNVVNFETSADAITWTTRKTATAGFALTAMKFYLVAGAWGTGNATPGTAIYNDFQYISNAPMPTFFDDFDDNSLNTAKWTVEYPTSPVVVSEQSQQLRLTLPASTAGYNSVLSNANYNMHGAAVQIELVQSVSQAGWAENMLKIEKDPQNYLLIDTGSGNTLFRSMVNGANDQLIIPFDSSAHRHWRVRHDRISNVVNFETSPDASTWTTRKTAVAGFALTAVKFYLVAGAWGTGNATPGAAIYDNFQYIASTSNGPINVALVSNGSTATTSSTWSNPPFSYLPSAVNNGDHIGLNAGNNSNWASNGTTLPQWVEVAFDGSKTISRIDVFSLQNDYHNPIEPTESTTFSLYGFTAFDVQYWNGSTWVTVPGGSITGNNKVWKSISFAPLTTTKIRVLINATSDGWSRMVEVEAWTP